jgi:hypothetical protein
MTSDDASGEGAMYRIVDPIDADKREPEQAGGNCRCMCSCSEYQKHDEIIRSADFDSSRVGVTFSALYDVQG